MKNVCPVSHEKRRGRFLAWFSLFTQFTMILAVFGTICFLIAGWDLLKAFSIGVVTALGAMLLAELVFKTFLYLRAIYNYKKSRGLH